jgi:hypothetical protein|tara:strand:- start:42 stop:671 length:630 start_codon:yes stop_codon:yes gene_type:complete
MAYGKIKADAIVYDNNGTDVEKTIASLATAAPLGSPTFTGTPAAPTAASGTNTTQIATTAFVTAAVPDISGKANTSDIGSTIQAFDADTAKTDVAQTYTAGQRGEVTTLTGTSPAPNLNDSNNFTITTSGTTAFGLPTNLAVGQTGSIFIVYGGSHGLSFNAAYKFVGGASSVTPTSSSGAIDRIDYIVQNASSGYECLTCNFTANYVS